MHDPRQWRHSLLLLGLLLSVSAEAAVGGGSGGDVPGGSATAADVVWLILYILLALLVSFLCSIAEAVLLSITPSYIEGQKEQDPKLAARIEELKRDKVDQSLAAILTLNTIAHTVGAIGAGAKATIVFGSMWFGLFSAVMTLLILFLSEIIPKTLGAVHWARLVRPVALFVRTLILVLYPLVWLSEKLTRLLSRGQNVHLFSREEFLAMARVGERTGHLRGDESRMIRSLFRFSQLKTVDLMTPRTVMTALPESLTVGQAAARVAEQPFSRMPVYDGDIDHIRGYVLKDDVLTKSAQGENDLPLASLRREILTVPEILAVTDLFENLISLREHIALVIDEHGGTSGLVTLEDLVETLVGQEIIDETDVVKNMRAAARKQWERRGGQQVG